MHIWANDSRKGSESIARMKHAKTSKKGGQRLITRNGLFPEGCASPEAALWAHIRSVRLMCTKLYQRAHSPNNKVIIYNSYVPK